MRKTKTFDCVEMKRAVQEIIYEEIKNMSLEEELAYWRRIHEKHAREYKKAQGGTSAS